MSSSQTENQNSLGIQCTGSDLEVSSKTLASSLMQFERVIMQYVRCARSTNIITKFLLVREQQSYKPMGTINQQRRLDNWICG